jgi:hypothetical protein
LASVFSCGKYCGAILHRGPKGYEAIAESGESHGFFNSQKEAAAALMASREVTASHDTIRD